MILRQIQRGNRRRRGLTIMLALGLMALVAVLVTTLGLLLSTQLRRTRAQEVGAEQRQLLLAGTQAALGRLEAGKEVGEMTVVLPAEAGEAALVCAELEKVGAEEVTVEIRAKVRGLAARETVRFVKEKGKWVVREAVLGAGQ